MAFDTETIKDIEHTALAVCTGKQTCFLKFELYFTF